MRIGTGPGLENAYLLNAACTWLDQVCADRPLVISCSFSGQYGGHDGCRVAERMLDEQFPLNKKGRAICIAAGNEAGSPVHALIPFKGEKAKGTATWVAPGGGARLTVFVNTSDKDDVVVKLTSHPTVRMLGYVHPLSESLVLETGIPYDNTGEQLGGELEVYSKSGKELEAHAYIQGVGLAGWVGHGRSRAYMVGTPGTAINPITVGSYDFNDRLDTGGKTIQLSFRGRPLELGAISAYSSPGYSRLGKIIKPDLAAPGQFHIAPAAADALHFQLETSGKYQSFNGTSAATPYTAGVVALLLERKPDLTLGEIKELLKQHAKSDKFTGNTPNRDWGHGKLNYEAVEAMVKGLKK